MQPQTLFLPANSRKCKDFGFMQSYLSFKPDLPEDRQSFGALITIDDAILKPDAKGFGIHSHKDLEVVTFIVQGTVKHIDPHNEQHSGILSAKGIQIISAGTGIENNKGSRYFCERFFRASCSKNQQKLRDHQCLRLPRFVLVTSFRPNKGSKHRFQMT